MRSHTKQTTPGTVLPSHRLIHRRPLRLPVSFWIALAGLALLSTGCALPRQGGKDIDCTDGQMTCEVSQVDYSFTTKSNSYRFKGYCYLTPPNGPSQEDPLVSFDVKGVYDRSSKQFQEAGEFSGAVSEKFAITGNSALDPWLFPYASAGVNSMAGDPYLLARELCVYEIPGQYYRIPFSRNVIIHVLHEDDRKQMIEMAKNPDPAPPPPPPPPCPEKWVTGPPELVVPVQKAVYGEGAKEIMVLLKTRCGPDNIKYKDTQGGLWSWYIVSSYYDTGGGDWKKGADVTVPMSSHPDGGSGGLGKLPIKAPGEWLVRAKQLITLKPDNEVTVSEPSEFTTFFVGKPIYDLSGMDFSKIEQKAFNQQAYQKMDEIWESGKFKTMTFMPPPRASKDSSSESAFGKEAARFKPATTAERRPSNTAEMKSKPPAGMEPGATGQSSHRLGVKRAAIPPPRSPAAKVESRGAGIKPAKLEFEDAGQVKVFKLTAGNSSKAIFPVLNSGDSASKATTFAVTCKKVSNADSKCPDFSKRGSLPAISAQGRRDIEVKLTSLSAGEYDLTLTLAGGALKTVKLEVAAARTKRTPASSESAPGSVQPRLRSR